MFVFICFLLKDVRDWLLCACIGTPFWDFILANNSLVVNFIIRRWPVFINIVGSANYVGFILSASFYIHHNYNYWWDASHTSDEPFDEVISDSEHLK